MDNSEVIKLTQQDFKPMPGFVNKIRIGKPIIKPKSVGDLVINKLLPFRFAMVTGLRRQGVDTTGMQFKTLIAVYYNEFSGRKINVSDFINNIVFKIGRDDEISSDISTVRNQTAMIEVSLIVDSVINLFKTSKQKYETALDYGYEPEKILTDEEIRQAKAARIVENDLLMKFKSDHYIKFSEVKTHLKWVLGLVVILYLCYLWD